MSELQWKSVLYQLRSQIVSGELIGGTKLRASHLAEHLDVSRTPVSEALIKLEGEGLLVRDKSGFTVRSFSLRDVYDAIDLRGILEGAAAQKAAERHVSKAELEQVYAVLTDLDSVIQQGSSGNDVGEYDQLNLDFHLCIAELSGSDILYAEVKRSYLLPFAGPSAFPITHRDFNRFWDSLIIGQHHHRQVVQAIHDAEGARAFALLVEHAKLAHQNVDVAIKTRETLPQLALVSDTQ